MDPSCDRISVAVEKCQLCCYSKRPMICSSCIQSGNFSHSSDEFIAENYYVNKRKLWLKKKSELKELNEKLTEYLEKDLVKKEKRLRIQRARVNVVCAKEALARLQQAFKDDCQAYDDSKARNAAKNRELATMKTKIRNILEHLKKQPDKQQVSSAKLHTSKQELAAYRRQLCSELVDKIFPISHSNDWKPVSCHEEMSEEELKQFSVYLSKNIPPPSTSLSTLQLLSAVATTSDHTAVGMGTTSCGDSNQSSSSSNVTLTDTSPHQQPSTPLTPHPPPQQPSVPSIPTSGPSEAFLETSFHSTDNAFKILQISTSTNPPTTSTNPPTTSTNPPTTSTNPPTTSTNPPTTSTYPPTTSTNPPTTSPYLPTTSTNPPTTSTNPPTTSTNPPTTSTYPPTTSTNPPTTSTYPPTTSTNPPTTSTNPPTTSINPPTTSTNPSKTFTNPPTVSTNLSKTSTNSPTTSTDSTTNSSPNQLLNVSAINLLKEARMTAFIDGRWVQSSEQHTFCLLHTTLPCNIRQHLKHKPSQCSDIKAGLSLLTQLAILLANILDCSLPRPLHFKDFSGDLTVRQILRRLRRLESNVQWLCHYQNLPPGDHSLNCLRSVYSLVRNPMLGCDEANRGVHGSDACFVDEVPRDDDEDDEEHDEDDDEDDNDGDESEVPMREPSLKVPRRKASYPGKSPKHPRQRHRNSSDNSCSNSEGNWEYISPHVELIPEQPLSSSSMGSSSSDTIGASVGAYVSSWLQAWRG